MDCQGLLRAANVEGARAAPPALPVAGTAHPDAVGTRASPSLPLRRCLIVGISSLPEQLRPRTPLRAVGRRRRCRKVEPETTALARLTPLEPERGSNVLRRLPA